VDVVSGFFVPDAQTPFERAMGATVLPAAEDIDPAGFLPSSRSVAFRREAWEEAGGYPEWLDYCEDLVFDLRLRELGRRFVFEPGAVVYFRPRSSMRAFFDQYYRYARGDGKADLWRKRHAIRYATYLLGPALVVWGLQHGGNAAGRAALLLVAVAAAAYTRRPYARLLSALDGLSPWQKAAALALVPAIRVIGDVAKMAGYPPGVLWRLKNR
jgi:GT2 family glycosyltransferase